MNAKLATARVFLISLIVFGFAGCSEWARGPVDEKKDPHFLAGKSHVRRGDYRAGVRSYEKALQSNPNSASAHYELGLLYYNYLPDPAAAIYHFRKFLNLAPDHRMTELVQQYIDACKQQLAAGVSPLPVTEQVQRELDNLHGKNQKLAEENQRLEEKLSQLNRLLTHYRSRNGEASTQVAQASRSAQTPSTASGSGSESSYSRRSSNSSDTQSSSRRGGVFRPSESRVIQGSRSSSQSYTVKEGDTPSSIARQFDHIDLQDFLRANPGLDPRRMRIGQVVKIPPK